MFRNEPISISLQRQPQQAPAAKPIIRVPEANPFTIINLGSYLQTHSIPLSIAPGQIAAAVISELMNGENKIEINCGKEAGVAKALSREGTELIEQRTGLSVEMEHLTDNLGNSYITYTANRPAHRPSLSPSPEPRPTDDFWNSF